MDVVTPEQRAVARSQRVENGLIPCRRSRYVDNVPRQRPGDIVVDPVPPDNVSVAGCERVHHSAAVTVGIGIDRAVNDGEDIDGIPGVVLPEYVAVRSIECVHLAVVGPDEIDVIAHNHRLGVPIRIWNRFAVRARLRRRSFSLWDVTERAPGYCSAILSTGRANKPNNENGSKNPAFAPTYNVTPPPLLPPVQIIFTT